MAKEKIFTPEDFDKPKPRKKKTFLIWILICLAIAALAVGIIAIVKSCDTQKGVDAIEQEQVQQVSTGSETQIRNEDPEATDKEISPETQVIEQVGDKQHDQTSVVETAKEEPKSQTSTSKPTSASLNVSDNIEQEAMNVIRGDYGNIPERREKLGSKYQEIQNRVNQLKKEGVF